MQSIKSTVGLCVVFISIVLVMFFFSKLRVPELSADEMRTQGVFILPTPRDIGPFELLDHTGAAFNRQSLEGHWSFIFFGFTNCPDVCPTTMAILNETYSKLKDAEKDNLQIVLLTLDPERDSVEKLADYVPYFNQDFIGVTGNKHLIRRLTAEINIAYSQVPLGNNEYTIDHSSQIVLINPKGDYHGFFKAPHSEVMLRQTWRSIYATFN
mgnify:CR=1 FL=1